VRFRWHHWQNNFGFFVPKDFRIDLNDDLLAVDSFLPSRVGNFELSFGRQNNIRKAFPPALGGRPAVHLDLDNTVFEGRFHHRKLGAVRGTLAAQLSGQKNTPLALGELMPEYENSSWAISIFEQAGFDGRGLEDRWLVSCALRYDNKTLEVPPDPSRDLHVGYQENWEAVTASAGLLYRLTGNLSLAGSAGRGWRAPSAFELFVNGVHGGVGAIQVGDRYLKEESNLNTEFSLRWSAARTRGYVTFFNNDFANYIYLSNTGETIGDLPVFEHEQSDAYLRGIEASLELALTSWLKTSAGYDYLKTKNKTTCRKLPLTYPARLLWSGRLEDKTRGSFSGTYAEFGLTWSDQGKIAGPEEPFPFNTESYTVFRAAAGTTISVSEDIEIALDLLVDNIFNTTYRDFLYTYKGVTDMPGRDIRLVARLKF
jgi:iron complex outermembrane receptor protein/hemoglobin/transferrin/lactoferrin receptor protein